MKIRDYRMTFNLSALILFALIMLPNIIWFCVPAPDDILRNESVTPVLDILATAAQVITVAALCIIKNENADKLKISPFLILSAAFCLTYYICWILYYCNIVNSFIVVCLCLPPCLSFMFYGIDRKNYIALIPTGLFTVLHFVSTLINFI